MKPTPLNRAQIDCLRANTEAFLKQHHGDTCILMPVLPKRLLLMMDTIDILFDEREEREKE
jgi:hypothetical protein